MAAKLMTMFLILIALQAVMMMYHNPLVDNQTLGNTQIWDFLWNMDNWSSIGFILTLSAIAAAIGLTGITSGSVFGFKTDFLIMAPAIGGLISMGVVFTNLANVVRDELTSRVFTDCIASSLPCTPVLFIVALTIGPIAFYYAWTVIEWWRGKDY